MYEVTINQLNAYYDKSNKILIPLNVEEYLVGRRFPSLVMVEIFVEGLKKYLSAIDYEEPKYEPKITIWDITKGKKVRTCKGCS